MMNKIKIYYKQLFHGLFLKVEKISSLKKSKNLKNRKKLLFDNAIKTNDTNVASAWSSLAIIKKFIKFS